MYIYKITNKINNKVYIGQVYNKTIYDRFNRHIKSASKTSKSYIGRAIYKYGANNFVIEQIDEAHTLQELNQKEIYWINKYNSYNREYGYNLTKGGDGGNTYLCKTPEELQEIKDKISKSNSGKNNGLAKSIKALNVITNEVLNFETLTDARKYFNIKNKALISCHCEKRAKNLWRNQWTFAYKDDKFMTNLNTSHDRSTNRGTTVKLVNLTTKEEIIFNSLNKLNAYLGVSKNKLKYTNNECIYNNYKITKLHIK